MRRTCLGDGAPSYVRVDRVMGDTIIFYGATGPHTSE